MSNHPFIKIVGVTKRFPGVTALDNVSFSIMKGEVHALLGENGAGKSTLIKLLTGVFPPESGAIFINDKKTNIRSPHHAHELGISAIFQDPILVPSMSVEENILLGREPRQRIPIFIERKQITRQAQTALDQLEIELDIKQKVSNLSPGQKQMVAIAKALTVDAQLLIMDEPTAALSEEEVNHLFKVIKNLRQGGISVIYVSHRMEEVFIIADRATVLRDGKYIGTRTLKDTNYNELVRMIVGRDIEIESQERQEPQEEVALKVNGISRSRYFQNVSFSIKKGEILALAGLVGSGRTDVARTIFGADSHTQGEILIFGKPISPKSPKQAIRLGINMVPEDRKNHGIFLQQSVLTNISISNIRNYALAGFVKPASERRSADAHVKQLRIVPPDLNRKAMTLSGGNQQKVVLAKTLDTQARILILDEPTAGVDVGSKSEIRALINKLANQGIAILLVSSEIPEIVALANRVIVMKEGRVVGELAGNQIKAENIIHLAMRGEPI
jgi:ribose transport system ATP-binding protein